MKTINKFLLLLGGLALMAGMSGCEDTRGEYLEDYASRVYFRNGGYQSISLYRVGKNAVYKVPVCKSGSDLSYTADVTVAAVDQAQLDIYNMESNTNYVQIPDSCFKFLTDKNLHFAAGETSKVVEVEIFTDYISVLQEKYPQNGYILALQLYSDREVSADINLLILEPDITVPVISFTEAGLHANTLNPESPDSTKITSQISLGMDNLWTDPITCEFGIHDQAWLDEYNAQNGTEYQLMPAEMYKFDSKAVFTEGSDKASFTVVFDRTDMGLFTEYVIPLYVSSCDKRSEANPDQEVFKLDDKVFIVHAMYTPTMESVVLRADMLSTDYTHDGDGIGLPGLVDGKYDTWWHSLYSNQIPGDPIYGVYIDITLDTPLMAVQFRYQTRSTTDNGSPSRICIGASHDGQEWKLVQDYQLASPAPANTWVDLPIANAKEAYEYYRFGVATSKAGDCRTEVPAFTNLGEIELYGI